MIDGCDFVKRVYQFLPKAGFAQAGDNFIHAIKGQGRCFIRHEIAQKSNQIKLYHAQGTDVMVLKAYYFYHDSSKVKLAVRKLTWHI